MTTLQSAARGRGHPRLDAVYAAGSWASCSGLASRRDFATWLSARASTRAGRRLLLALLVVG